MRNPFYKLTIERKTGTPDFQKQVAKEINIFKQTPFDIEFFKKTVIFVGIKT